MIIDFHLLLAPISDAVPAGRNIEYEQACDDIRQARESDPNYLPQGEWATELRKADWDKVVRLSTQVLTRDSKDLQVACWLTEGLSQQHGTKGLLAGMNFLASFIEHFWQNGWPELNDDGALIRHGILNRLDRQLALLLNFYPLTGEQESTLDHWLRVLAYEHKVAMKPDSAVSPGSVDDFSMESLDRWAASLQPQELSQQRDELSELVQVLETFEVDYARLNPQAGSHALRQTRSVIVELQDYMKRLFFHATPVYDDVKMLNVLAPSEKEQGTEMGTQNNSTQKQGMSRDLAISQMLTIAHFFRQTEPSSPVPFLMERAARWAGMTLTEWLQEMLDDDNSMRSINNVLKGQGRI
ncbi:type VI secretion system protein TssA (plasmid) [Hafnia alvei]|uniref:type VI secretion system protein TssA n=1 Tax=Hafnia alvei TaxID=569 RepID=UPI000B7052A4|nr:type VI secretion system protein TssA [Hafnia alvei]MBI0278598.1 type VI secretion system protein TssA [Hafnia alvei]PNL03893.1 type VI secretion system protein TssA [Hafnia alvei]